MNPMKRAKLVSERLMERRAQRQVNGRSPLRPPPPPPSGSGGCRLLFANKAGWSSKRRMGTSSDDYSSDRKKARSTGSPTPGRRTPLGRFQVARHRGVQRPPLLRVSWRARRCSEHASGLCWMGFAVLLRSKAFFFKCESSRPVGDFAARTLVEHATRQDPSTSYAERPPLGIARKQQCNESQCIRIRHLLRHLRGPRGLFFATFEPQANAVAQPPRHALGQQARPAPACSCARVWGGG